MIIENSSNWIAYKINLEVAYVNSISAPWWHYGNSKCIVSTFNNTEGLSSGISFSQIDKCVFPVFSLGIYKYFKNYYKTSRNRAPKEIMYSDDIPKQGKSSTDG